MSTSGQAAANLANAHLSTGPKTDEGKAASSQKSLKQRLTAKIVLLPGETLAPGNTIESSLTKELINLQWRLQRVPRLEASLLDADLPDFKALNNISLHAARMKRQFSATLKEFHQLQAVRKQQEESAMLEAITHRRADVILQRPTDLAQFGFVFTVDEVDHRIRRDDALSAAKRALSDAAEAKRPFYGLKPLDRKS